LLIRGFRAPPTLLLDLDDAAALLDHHGISGRALVAVALSLPEPLLYGCRPDDALPQPLGRGRVTQLQLHPGNVIDADGVPHHRATVRWARLCDALIAAGCRGADRLPRNPVLSDLQTGEELPFGSGILLTQPGWWTDAYTGVAISPADEPGERPPAAETPPTPQELVARHSSFRKLWKEVLDRELRGKPGYQRERLRELFKPRE
jgi:hypothetical protein